MTARICSLARLALLTAGAVLLLVPVADAKETGHRVAVLGDSRTDGCVGAHNVADCRANDRGYDEKTLSQLLEHAADKHPDAVFFTGDLTLGYEREEDEGLVEPSNSPAANGWARNYEYDTTTFARMLGDFSGTVARALKTIPFHPVVGNHDAVGPDALKIFRGVFKLNLSPTGTETFVGGRSDLFEDPTHLAYVVAPAGTNAAFIVVATDYYLDCKGGKTASECNLQEHHVSAPQLEWLDRALENQRGKRLFVLGHEPAFSASPAAAPVGLDADPAARDAFWALLVKHRVTAYFCSHQHRYNISQHEGVWQIVSGGGGAPLDRQKLPGVVPLDQCTGGVVVDEANRATSIFNYALLTLPEASGEPPLVEIRDCKDRVRAALPLLPGFAVAPKPMAKLPAKVPAQDAPPATSASPASPATP